MRAQLRTQTRAWAERIGNAQETLGTVLLEISTTLIHTPQFIRGSPDE